MKDLNRALLLILLPLLAFGCNDEYLNYNGNTGKIKTGTTVDVSSTSVGTGGGTVSVDEPGTPVDGMEIIIPEYSYASGQTFKISYAKVTGHEFGENFNPISPLITISCDGGYAAELMSVTIPVVIPEGSVAIGFYFDEVTGKLEGIPVESATSNSITLLTRHFLSGNMLSSGSSSLKSKTAETNKGASIIISSISESVLKLKTVISSGFKPGVDDWEFVNYGSYIAPYGHCLGQSMTAMWYYFEKKSSDGNLFNKFSDNANLWQDNARGYRFSSVIQKDIKDGDLAEFFWKHIDRNQGLDKLKLYSIAGAMLVTGEPQGVNIFRQTGKNAIGIPKYSGHAVVCYQVAINEGLLYISDPNKPGIGQSIEFKNNKFEPYIAKQNGNAASDPYPFITWYAKTACIEWNLFENRYAELSDSTIGNRAPNTFPAYTIWVKGKVNSVLKDGLSTNNDTLMCFVECPAAAEGFQVEGKNCISFDLFDTNGTDIRRWTNGKGWVILKPGLNKIGFYMRYTNPEVVDPDGSQPDTFIDFKWFNINYTKLEISPSPVTGEPEQELTITARPYGSAPKNAKYVWNFGDGTADVTVNNDSIVRHTYPVGGDYNVDLKLYDSSTGKIAGTATAKAIIAQALHIGQSYGGGIIFYIDSTGKHGLIAAPSNQSAAALWGCWGTTIGTSDAIGTGQANTTAIINGCGETGIAARLCNDLVLGGFSDWFLPSKDELDLLWWKKDNVGGFPEGQEVWSSSEDSPNNAWCMTFKAGSGAFVWGKSNPKAVRAVRAF
jgi:hypothetical protein